MKILQDTKYIVTEWDGEDNLVTVKTIGGKVVQRRQNGEPHLCVGGTVLMRYESDGLTHQVSAEHFKSLNPRVAILVN